MAKMTSTSITFAAADTTPVTFDDSPTTGYPSLNYTLVGEVVEIPEYGPSAQVVESNPLAEGVTEKFKGFINYGSVNIGLEADFEDAGQAMLTAAVDGLGKYKRHTFRITYPNGSSEYFSGKVFSFTRNIGSANSMIGASANLEIETKILRVNGDPNVPTAGQVRILSGVGPAPGIEQIYSGSIWRPRGGRQVLAKRVLNPVTVQSLAEIAAETLGPFPGGLVRAGMQLRLNWVFANGAIGTGARLLQAWVGPVGSIVASGQFGYWQTAANSIAANGELISRINVLADASANHIATPSSNSSPLVLTGGYQAQNPSVFPLIPLVDFSQAWGIALRMQSAAETPVTITGATWSAGVATYTTSAAHTLAVGDKDVVSGITPSGYNGTFIVSYVGSPTTFSVPMAVNPGTWVSGPGSSSRISNMISQSYVLELIG